MARLFLVRHGQASFGSDNYDRLSEQGRQQSLWLGEYFSKRGLVFSRVVSGTLHRQQDTARYILEGMRVGDTSLTMTQDSRWNEYSGEAIYRAYTKGQVPTMMQNQSPHQYWQIFRDAMRNWSEGSLKDVPESWMDFGQRIQNALGEILSGATKEEVILIVSSGGVIGRVVTDALQAPAISAIYLNFQIYNSGICEMLGNSPDKLRLCCFNAISHLEYPERRVMASFT